MFRWYQNTKVYGFWESERTVGPQGTNTRRAPESSLERELRDLLPTLMNARDYRGASNILSVIYSHFFTDPVKCITTSLEILRRLPETTPTLIEYYHTLLTWKTTIISNDVILREQFLLLLLQGSLHEAYSFYKEHMQIEVLQEDIHVVGGFGMVCYWLLFREDRDLREGFLEESDSSYHVQHIVGTAPLYQDALVSFRRAMTLCPESNIFVEYYVQVLVMKNDYELAADYLEHYYHSNSNEPHSCRMLLEFYLQFFPDSVPCHVDISLRWNELDPSANTPLKTLLEAHKNDLVESDLVIMALCRTLDHCGSDYNAQLNGDLTCFAWEELANLLGPVKNPDVVEIQPKYFQSRAWWQRVMFPPKNGELNALKILKCIVAIHQFGTKIPFVNRILHQLEDSTDYEIRNMAEQFNLLTISLSSNEPPRKRLKPTRIWSSELDWSPSIGNLRMPHVMSRPQILHTFKLHDAIRVQEIDMDTGPSPSRIPSPPVEINIVNPHLHPYDWLRSKRSGQANVWHVEVASTGHKELMKQTQPPSISSSILTEKDCFTLATEDELLLNEHATRDHLITSYRYKNLPIPTSKEASKIMRTLRRHPFKPNRIPVRFLWWIQYYMQMKGNQANPQECREYLASKWHEVGGRCRGFPSIKVLTKILNYFEGNPALLPSTYRNEFRSFLIKNKHLTLHTACGAFYTQITKEGRMNVPSYSIFMAALKEWDTISNRIQDVKCYPIHVDSNQLDVNETIPDSSFLIPEYQRYLISIRQWLEDESPLNDETLKFYMKMNFDSTEINFPTNSTIHAMIQYIRIQLHAQYTNAPSIEDSIYYQIPKNRLKSTYRKYMEDQVMRHPFVSFDDICLLLLKKTNLPPSNEPIPTVETLYKWWKATSDQLIHAGLGLGTQIEWKKKKSHVKPPHLAPTRPATRRDVESHEVMEIFPI